MDVCHSSTITSWQVCYIARAKTCLKSQNTEVSTRVGKCWICCWKNAGSLFWSLAFEDQMVGCQHYASESMASRWCNALKGDAHDKTAPYKQRHGLALAFYSSGLGRDSSGCERRREEAAEIVRLKVIV